MLPVAIRSVLRRAKARRGLSIILLAFLLAILACFLAFAVDIGRMRVAKAQLQTAADAAACAGVRELPFVLDGGIERAEETAIETAAHNVNLDQAASNNGGMRSDSSVVMLPVEDIEFGIWRPDFRTFELVEDYGGETDDRKRANAVRAWGRRVTTFEREDMLGGVHEIDRNDGLPLIFGPIFKVPAGEIQTRATAYFYGGAGGWFGFVGLTEVKFNGTTKTDSYTSASETYPGAGGPNQNGGVASNGDIELVGGTQIWGDARPGENNNVQPIPLGDNVEVTGYMRPLDEPLDFPIHSFTAPTTQPYNEGGTIIPPNVVKGPDPGYFQQNGSGEVTFRHKPGTDSTYVSNFYFKSSGNQPAWSSGSQSQVIIDNTEGPMTFYIDGDLKSSAQAGVHIKSAAHKVTFIVNGDFDMQGGGIINDGATTGSLVKPENLYIDVTMPGTHVDIGGNPTTAAHIYAPGSDVKFHGNGQDTNGFWGWVIGGSLTVNGNFELHYDETGEKQESKDYRFRLVD